MKDILKNKKMMLAVAALVVIAIIILVVRKRKDSGKESDGAVPGSVKSSLPVATFPLRPQSQVGEYSAAKGSYGQQIAELQKLCNKKYGAGLDIDGKWGPKTDEVFRSRLGTLLFPGGISEAQYKVFLNQ